MKRIFLVIIAGALLIAAALLFFRKNPENSTVVKGSVAEQVTETVVLPSPTATVMPTEAQTEEPTQVPTEAPTAVPTATSVPTEAPTEEPMEEPVAEEPTEEPTEKPVAEEPTEVPTEAPTEEVEIIMAEEIQPDDAEVPEVAQVYFPNFVDEENFAHVKFVGRDEILVSTAEGIGPAEPHQGSAGRMIGLISHSFMPRTFMDAFTVREIKFLLFEEDLDIFQVIEGITVLNEDGNAIAIRVQECLDTPVVARIWLNPDDMSHYWDIIRNADGDLIVPVRTNKDPDYCRMPEETPAPATTYGGYIGGGSPVVTTEPTEAPTEVPTEAPTEVPTEVPTQEPQEEVIPWVYTPQEPTEEPQTEILPWVGTDPEPVVTPDPGNSPVVLDYPEESSLTMRGGYVNPTGTGGNDEVLTWGGGAINEETNYYSGSWNYNYYGNSSWYDSSYYDYSGSWNDYSYGGDTIGWGGGYSGGDSGGSGYSGGDVLPWAGN